MASTVNLNIALVEQSQAQKEVTVNEALIAIDAILNRGVIDKDLNIAPSSPSDGDLYIVGPSATGSWVGHDGEIAYFSQIWRFITPNEGMLFWVNDENKLYVYNSSSWVIA